jgi:hypothetical protein
MRVRKVLLRGGELGDYVKNFIPKNGGLANLIFKGIFPVLKRSEACQSKLSYWVTEVIFWYILYRLISIPSIPIISTRYEQLNIFIQKKWASYVSSTNRVVQALTRFVKNLWENYIGPVINYVRGIKKEEIKTVEASMFQKATEYVGGFFDNIIGGVNLAASAKNAVDDYQILSNFYENYKEITFYDFVLNVFSSLHYIICSLLNVFESTIGAVVYTLFPGIDEYLKGFHVESSFAASMLEFISLRDVSKYVDFYRYRKNAKVYLTDEYGNIVYKEALINGVKGDINNPLKWAPIFWDHDEWRYLTKTLGKPVKRSASRSRRF